MNSFIPDWTRLSCFRLLFLAARPARWLRPLMTPPETVTPRDGRRQTITNFLLSFNLYVMLKLKTATQYSQLLYFLWRLSEVDEMISLITSGQDQHSAYNYQQRKDPQHIFIFIYTKLPVIRYKYTTINFSFNLVMTVSF